MQARSSPAVVLHPHTHSSFKGPARILSAIIHPMRDTRTTTCTSVALGALLPCLNHANWIRKFTRGG